MDILTHLGLLILFVFGVVSLLIGGVTLIAFAIDMLVGSKDDF